MAKYEKDKIVTGYVTGIEPYGIFVSLDDYYNGLFQMISLKIFLIMLELVNN